MNILSGLYFPETAPDIATLKKLLVFFDAITCLRPVENEAPDNETVTQAGLLKELCPAPLGKGRDNFLKFIKDVRQYGPEYLEGSLASLSMKALRDSDEDSVWSLVASLKKSPSNKEKNNTTQHLWRARFILKMEEIHAREERELLRSLQNAAAKKKEILKSLQNGAEAADLNASGQIVNEEEISPAFDTAFTSQRLIQVEPSMSSWTELFGYLSLETAPWIATTAYKDAAALLIDTCSADNEPVSLGSIMLPALHHLHDDGYIPERDDLQQQLKERRAGIFRIIHEAARLEITKDRVHQLQTLFGMESKTWEDTLVKAGRTPETTVEKLDFFLFPEASLQKLFSRFTKTKHENIKEGQPAPNAILAVLT